MYIFHTPTLFSLSIYVFTYISVSLGPSQVYVYIRKISESSLLIKRVVWISGSVFYQSGSK